MLSIQANRGRALEELMEMVFEAAGPDVCIHRQNNKWVPIRGQKAFPQKGAPIDFIGVMHGNPVAFECKEASGKRLPLNQNRFPDKEITALHRFVRAGGHAFIVVVFWQLGQIAVFPFARFYERYQDYQNGGRASIQIADAPVIVSVAQVGALPVVLRRLGWIPEGRVVSDDG